MKKNKNSESIDRAFDYCRKIAKSHYENFPVGSILFPKHIRQDIFNIYAFARTADDIADDSELSKESKLKELDFYNVMLNDPDSDHPIFISLHETLKNHPQLKKENFYNLLDAFVQDSHQLRYKTLTEIEDYAKRSANPVGRIILELFNEISSENLFLSDQLCSGLQYINFWQDLSIDRNMNRYYVPEEVLKKNGLELNDFYFSDQTESHNSVINDLISWTEGPYLNSKKLITKVKSIRLKAELFFIWHGGMIMLNEIKSMRTDLLNRRPKVSYLKALKYFTGIK